MKDVIAITFDAGSGGPVLTAQERRQIETGLYNGSPAGTVFSGYRGGSVGIVGSAATIQPLTFVIQGTGTGTTPVATQGAYRGAFPSGSAELAKTISAPHATLVRWDALDIRVYDHEADATGLRGADIIYTAGTANATPSLGLPAALPNSIRMGHFVVPQSGGGASTFVADTGSQYAMAGGARTNGTGGLEIYDLATTTWRTVWQSVPAHFEGSYNPGVPSNIANATWIPMPVTTTVSNSRVTLVGGNSLRIDEAGLFQLNGSVRVGTGTAAGTGLYSRWTVNGAVKRQYAYPPTTSSITLPVACTQRLAATDVIKYEVFQDQGSARPFNLDDTWNYMDVVKVG
jgi:hypothetical protein